MTDSNRQQSNNGPAENNPQIPAQEFPGNYAPVMGPQLCNLSLDKRRKFFSNYSGEELKVFLRFFEKLKDNAVCDVVRQALRLRNREEYGKG